LANGNAPTTVNGPAFRRVASVGFPTSDSCKIELKTFFIFPERDEKDRAMELLQTAEAETVRRVLRILEDGRE
jgi:hypothetical protein